MSSHHILPYFSLKNGRGRSNNTNDSLRRAQRLGIRYSSRARWTRSKSFTYAVRAIVILVLYAITSFTLILSQYGLHYFKGAPTMNTGNDGSRIVGQSRFEICTTHNNTIWHNKFDTHFNELSRRNEIQFAIVLNVNNEYWDFYLNWYRHFQILNIATNSTTIPRVSNPMLILIAEDSITYEKLQDFMHRSQTNNYVIVHGKESTATNLLNVMCSLNAGEEVIDDDSSDETNKTTTVTKKKADTNENRDDISLIYTDVSTIWLKNPFPFIQKPLYGDMEHYQPKHDILVAIDSYKNITGGRSTIYSTGFIVLAQTLASINLLSFWESSEMYPTLDKLFTTPNLPIPNTWNNGVYTFDIDKFPSSRLYLDEWTKENNKTKMERAIVIHNNSIDDGHENKLKKFQDHGLWIDDEGR